MLHSRLWMALPLIALLPACTAPGMIASAAATTGVAAAQERPMGNAVDDASIRAELNHLFLQKDINDLFPNISIDVMEGRVLLTGSVIKPETKVEAVRLAWKPKGVKEVINEIQVTGGTHVQDYALDTWISGQIKGRMLLERGLRSINFNVETVNQKVYILGIARDQTELNKATTIASTTKYVKEVISHVLLQNDPRRGKNMNTSAPVNRGGSDGASRYNPNDSYDAQRMDAVQSSTSMYGTSDGTGGVQPGSIGVREIR